MKLDAVEPVAGSDSSDLAGEDGWPPPRQAWWAVFVFSVTLAVSYLDRGVLNLLVEPIKNDLDLSDTQLSLVMGFAFVTLYLLLGLPVARLVDTGSRRRILGIAAAVWSVSTMLCGLASNFIQLALCRVGVGAGDSAVSPAISSAISDLFPKERLARAMSILGLAFVAGNGLALLLGGLVIGALTRVGTVDVPILGTIYPWQATFIIVGFPGLIAAMLYLTVPEPKRRGRSDWNAPGAPTLRTVLVYLKDNRRLFAPMFIGLALHSIVGSGVQAWTPAFFERTYDWSPERYGTIAGTLGLIVNPLGILIGFRIAEFLYERGYADANPRITAIAYWCAVPLMILAPLMPDPHWALALILLNAVIGIATIGAMNAAMLVVMPNRMRGQITALYLVMYNVIGYGLGPSVVAVVTDYVFGNDKSLYLALATVAAVLTPVSAYVYTKVLKPYREAMATINMK